MIVVGLLSKQAEEIEREFSARATLMFCKPAKGSPLPRWHGDVAFVMTRFVNHEHTRHADSIADRVVLAPGGTSSLARAIDGYLTKFHKR